MIKVKRETYLPIYLDRQRVYRGIERGHRKD